MKNTVDEAHENRLVTAFFFFFFWKKGYGLLWEVENEWKC